MGEKKEYRGGWLTRRRLIEVYDKDGDLMRRFKSPWQAAVKTGFDERMIANALETGLPYNGFVWKYKEGANMEGGVAY
jgi:hypothetical protein